MPEINWRLFTAALVLLTFAISFYLILYAGTTSTARHINIYDQEKQIIMKVIAKHFNITNNSTITLYYKTISMIIQLMIDIREPRYEIEDYKEIEPK